MEQAPGLRGHGRLLVQPPQRDLPERRVWDNRHLYDSQVIRKYTFGKYKDMLAGVGQAPVDAALPQQRAESTKDAPNENYGREVLELHTVGVDAGYDENDIYNSAQDPHRTHAGQPAAALSDATPVDAPGVLLRLVDPRHRRPVTIIGKTWSTPTAASAG